MSNGSNELYVLYEIAKQFHTLIHDAKKIIEYINGALKDETLGRRYIPYIYLGRVYAITEDFKLAIDSYSNAIKCWEEKHTEIIKCSKDMDIWRAKVQDQEWYINAFYERAMIYNRQGNSISHTKDMTKWWELKASMNM